MSSDTTSILKSKKKSTLTQQQKNQKRQRATPKQLSVLRSEFMINSTPNAKIREQIGHKIDMTERSVQIWFQNKRAKTKQFARKSATRPGFTLNTVSNSMSQGYLGPVGVNTFYAPPLMSPMASPLSQAPFSATATSFLTASTNAAALAQMGLGMGLNNSITLACTGITIGGWRRVASGADMQVAYELVDNSLTYTVIASSTVFRIKTAMADIKVLQYKPCLDTPDSAEVIVQLVKAPSFSIQTTKLPGTWIPCQDFTEMKQASYMQVHKLLGPALQLQMQLAQISALQPTKVMLAGGAVSAISGVSRSLASSPVGKKYPEVQPSKQRSMSMPTVVTTELSDTCNSNSNSNSTSNTGDADLFAGLGAKVLISPVSETSQGAVYSASSDLWAPTPASMLNTQTALSFVAQDDDDIIPDDPALNPSYILDSIKNDCNVDAIFQTELLDLISDTVADPSQALTPLPAAEPNLSELGLDLDLNVALDSADALLTSSELLLVSANNLDQAQISSYEASMEPTMCVLGDEYCTHAACKILIQV